MSRRSWNYEDECCANIAVANFERALTENGQASLFEHVAL